jgi:hypothetical protein
MSDDALRLLAEAGVDDGDEVLGAGSSAADSTAKLLYSESLTLFAATYIRARCGTVSHEAVQPRQLVTHLGH